MAALRSAISRCTSTAQRTASRTLANSTRRPSPVVFDDATAVLLDLGIAELASYRLDPSEGALLVLAHQPRVARDIGGQYR
jgi:hypothetical protein